MRSAKDFFRPLAVGAPEPLPEVPVRPSRMIHFFDPGNERMTAKVPSLVGTVDILLGNLEDAVKPDRREAARAGLMVDACVAHGTFPSYGPFGDIADTVACEDQFRNALLLGCVGTWSLHPVQIAIAKKVFSPSAVDVAHARRVKAAMGDGTGAVMHDGRMEDDASLKQCHVILELADRLSATDPELAVRYAVSEVAAP